MVYIMEIYKYSNSLGETEVNHENRNKDCRGTKSVPPE
jgi:hypothetical protein